MSTAVQSSNAIKTISLSATTAVDLVRILAPSIDSLAEQLRDNTPRLNTFAINAQLMTIQKILAEAKREIDRKVLGEHGEAFGRKTLAAVPFSSPTGRWILEISDLVYGLSERVRTQLYREGRDAETLRGEIIFEDSPSSLSLPRLIRAFIKSCNYTAINLADPKQREMVGIKTDFNSAPFNKYLSAIAAIC